MPQPPKRSESTLRRREISWFASPSEAYINACDCTIARRGQEAGASLCKDGH